MNLHEARALTGACKTANIHYVYRTTKPAALKHVGGGVLMIGTLPHERHDRARGLHLVRCGWHGITWVASTAARHGTAIPAAGAASCCANQLKKEEVRGGGRGEDGHIAPRNTLNYKWTRALAEGTA